jgi:hypothetical protein
LMAVMAREVDRARYSRPTSVLGSPPLEVEQL